MEKRNIAIIAVAAVLIIALLAAAFVLTQNDNGSKDNGSSDVVSVKSIGLGHLHAITSISGFSSVSISLCKLVPACSSLYPSPLNSFPGI